MGLRTASGERRVNLRGSFNFRDLGGYHTVDGMRTRWRRVFRSDALHHLTSADQADLTTLGLVSVLDLRTPEEVAEQGWSRALASDYHLPMPDVLPSRPGQGRSAEPMVVAASYAAALAASADSIREILAILTDPSSFPAVVCCSSGVDRAGVVAAVLLGLLGVDDNVIVTDFAASREAMLRRVGRLRFEHPTAVSHDLDRFGPGMLGVIPDAMALFLRHLRAEHGSFLGYAESIDMAGAVPYLRTALLHRRG